MHTTDQQIEDWLREIEERPASAAAILRAIAARLNELDAWNEELLSDNIALRSGNKVEEYEARIAQLEYQLELLKRRVGSEAVPVPQAGEPGLSGLSLFFFNAGGQILRLRLPVDLPAGGGAGRFNAPLDPHQPPGMFVARDDEELLFVFDSGRSQSLPAAQFESASALEWQQAQRILPRPGEELAAVLPVGALALAEACVQVSRRACAKLMPKASFQAALARGAVGAGIKRKPDRTALLTLCGKDDALILATREGCVVTLPVSRLPFSVEEVMQLSANDHVVTGLAYNGQSDLVFVTNNGKAVRRDAGWLEPPGSFKSRGQAVFSAARRESGVRLAGAAALRPTDRYAALLANGEVRLGEAGPLLEGGALDSVADYGIPASAGVLAFAAIRTAV